MCQLPFESCPVMSIMKHAARANAQSLHPPKKREAGSARQVSEQRYWVRHQVGRVGEVGWARCVWQDAADITQW